MGGEPFGGDEVVGGHWRIPLGFDTFWRGGGSIARRFDPQRPPDAGGARPERNLPAGTK